VSKRNSGEAFEELFARQMKLKFGVATTERRCKLRGRTAATPYECDVHGVLRSRVWRILQLAGFLTLVVAAWALIKPGDLPGIEAAARAVERDIESKIGPDVAGLGLLILGTIGLLFGTIGNHRHTRHIWVECKDRKASIKRADISKLERSAADVRANRTAEWRPHLLWFASTSAYDQDAVAIARQYGVRCFQVVEDELIEW
jgi:hypothetical protein